jgi:predicted nucleic acid-binding protein
LVARQEIDASDAAELFAFLQTAPVFIVEHDDALERAALELALALRHPVYDCVYVALAQRTKRTLVTVNMRFLLAIRASGITTAVLALDELGRGSASEDSE